MPGRNPLREKLARGQRVIGCLSNLASPVAAELAGLAGYDFVLIDGEHGPGSHGEHRAMVQAVAATPASSAFRVAGNQSVELKRAADLGVHCLVVPEVQSAAEAAEAVAATFYPPKGRRSFGAPLLRASAYGSQTQAYVDDMAEGGVVMAMLVETAEGAKNAAAIATVDGADVIFVGPHDIAATLGLLGQVDHPRVQEAIAGIEAAAIDAGKILGGLPYGSVGVGELCRRGYRFIVAATDVGVLRDQLVETLAQCKTY